MLINEIEVVGSSLSLKCWETKTEDIVATFDRMMQQGDQFNLEDELPGFHDCDANEELIRGFYSIVVPFEIEHLIDGITTKTLFKRIESCEFIMTSNMLYVYGKPNPGKLLASSLAAVMGTQVELIEFDFEQMSQLQERMSKIKSIVVTNPKDKEIRRARLAGHMENYTEYNIIDPRNHGIDSVSGLIFTPLGPMTLTVGRKGSLRMTVKKGFVMTVECIEWILALVREEQAPIAKESPEAAAAPF